MPNYEYSNTALRWRNQDNGQFVAESTVIAEMRHHVNATFSELDRLTNQLYSGGITIQQWQIATAQELSDAHLAQSMFAVGGRANMTAVEWGRVGGTLADEYRYLANFANDIAIGKVSQAQALARIKQYGRATQQSYWREYANATEGNIHWNLSPAEHCGDCLELANNSPYTAQTLTTYPGAGATQCRGNCQCTLSRAA